jgi:hypothetical protein
VILEGNKAMKELANSFAQLAAIIMVLITLAVSTAAISQWGGQDVSAGSATATTQRAMPLSLDAR